jgi:ubiquitin carboxyl-terminal hydrolase L3
VQVAGQLYELDGRKPAPLVLGPSSEETFLKDAAAACQGYMSRDPENINFSVLALTAAAAS